MASHDSWIDAGELAALAGKLTPPGQEEPPADFEENGNEAAFVPFISEPTESKREPEPGGDVVVFRKRPAAPAPATKPQPDDTADDTAAEENTGASPEVLALWNRKLAEIKQRARCNGLLKNSAAPAADISPPKRLLTAFSPPDGSVSERLASLSRWLRTNAPDCEFFACDDWGNELLAGSNAAPDLAAAALTLSLSACEAGEKTGDGTPAFLCTDLGDGLLSVFPSANSGGRRFLAAVSEEPFDLETARLLSAAFRSVI